MALTKPPPVSGGGVVVEGAPVSGGSVVGVGGILAGNGGWSNFSLLDNRTNNTHPYVLDQNVKK